MERNRQGNRMESKEYYRKIPKVDRILAKPQVAQLETLYGKACVLEAVQEELGNLRALAGEGRIEDMEVCLAALEERIGKRAEEKQQFSLKPVLNATGILLHTNLGRAPLGQYQTDAMVQAARGYCNLEYNLQEGTRGKRAVHYAEEITRVTGAEAAVAVNNNAAAVTLMLSALAKGKEVIVSRGEMIEIGGHFRIPEVMEQSGAVLRETGCTNRTRISDYEKAINENTGALLKVHTSNYRILGFTEEVTVQELAALGKKYQLPVLVDLGSGVLQNLEEYGLAHEPSVQETLAQGADVVSFSGDKLLGGPQAGILAGKKAYIKEMETHPLMRALRLDKCLTAALAATFRAYRDKEQARRQIPVLSMLSRTREELKRQAEEIADAVKDAAVGAEIRAEESTGRMGGGSLPGEDIPSYAVTVAPRTESCEHLMMRLRSLPVPVIAYIREERIFLDMRTIMPEEKELLIRELKMCLTDREKEIQR